MVGNGLKLGFQSGNECEDFMRSNFRPAVASFIIATSLAVPAQAAAIAFVESFASTNTSNTTNSSGFDCSESDQRFGHLRTCNTQRLFYDEDSGTFYQLDSSSQALGAFGNLRTRSSLNYQIVDLFVQDEDGTLVVYTSDPNAELGEGEEPARRIGNLDTFSALPTQMEANAFASVQDAWLITGGESGATGTLELDFQFDGESSSPSVVNGVNVEYDLFASSSTTLLLRGRDGIGGQVDQIGGSITSGFNGAVDELATLELGFTFGEGFAIELLLRSASDIFANFTADAPVLREAMTSTNFFNTASLTDFRVFDENEQEIEFNLVSNSNSPSFQQFSTLTAIPLPAGAPLLIGAIGVLGLIRLRRAA